MTTTELQAKANEINKRISGIERDYPDVEPITDGIIDIEKYLKAKYRILWILKEPYDDFNEDGSPSGGGWNIGEAFRPKKGIEDFAGNRATFLPLVYTAWGIFNDFCLWGNMKNLEDDPSMLDALKSIAYINVKKLPGLTASNTSSIGAAYEKHRDILLDQIEYINPDIIIGGSTLSFFLKDFGFAREQMHQNEGVKYFEKDGRLYIDTYHPAQRIETQEKYCNDIINTVKIFYYLLFYSISPEVGYCTISHHAFHCSTMMVLCCDKSEIQHNSETRRNRGLTHVDVLL